MQSIKNYVVGPQTKSWTEIKDYELNDLKPVEGRDLTNLKNAIVNKGFRFPVAIWHGHRYVIDGSGRLMALKQLAEEGYSMEAIPFFEVEAENLQEAKHLVLMASSTHGPPTNESISEFIKDMQIDDALLATISIPELDMIYSQEEGRQSPKGDPDDAPDVNDKEPPFTQTGDVYQIGSHRLLCGDSEAYSDVQTLMDGNMADMILTDPPLQRRLRGQDQRGPDHRQR